MNKKILIAFVCLLAVVLAVLVGVVIMLDNAKPTPVATTPAPTTTVPATPEPTPETTPEVTTVPETTPEATTIPETTPETTVPQPVHYTLSFAGDCTLASDEGVSGKGSFAHTVGSNYAYPFADVKHIFEADDCTFVNLECVLSNRGKAVDKQFTFRGSPEYINILTQGSVEFASVVNNHVMDYGKDAYDDTLALLDGAGIQYAENKSTTVFTTESGLKIGVLGLMDPNTTTNIKTWIRELRSQGAEIVVVAVHWGREYWYKPNSTQKTIAHYAIDGGADIVFGTHPHVLQPIEQYKDGYIFYSLGNFSFGGNRNPADKDTAILQVDIIRELDGTVRMGEVNIVACYVSGILTYGNDYQPVPMDPEKDQAAIERVHKKLDGTYELDNILPNNRPDLNPPTTPPETTPGETLPGETTIPGQSTEPSENPGDTTPDPEPEPEPKPEPEPQPEPQPEPGSENPGSDNPEVG